MIIFSQSLPFWEILGKNCFVKRAMDLQFRTQKVTIEMGLILRLGSVQGAQSIVNGLYTHFLDVTITDIYSQFLLILTWGKSIMSTGCPRKSFPLLK